ncbi:hypothetical protein [Synechococcus sp. UW179B]|uniref:hypothetical protein n=1 Tax=Synechococcus sp. UW179B TaxID=2575516 RepID=UPI000E0E6A8E|nr:hypothetical protein [Synechococcus sp. UW179B]
MTVFGTNDRRYGTLAQLETYDGLACAPTAVTNALLALDLDGLLAIPDSPGSHESLFNTRAVLAKKYFHTSREWEKAGLAKGSPPSLTLTGTRDYIKDLGFERNARVSALGLNIFNGRNLAGFDVIAEINGETIATPELTNAIPYAVVGTGSSGSNGIFDYLAQNLNLGPVIFGGFYLGPNGEPDGQGHALTATKIIIDDENSNAIIEKGEASIYFIDPLNPSTSYSPKIGDRILADFNSVKSTGSANFIKADIWEGTDGFLKVKYDQQSLQDANNILDFTSGDSSNNRSENTTTVAVAMAMAINNSNIPENFGQALGENQINTPGILNFNNLENPEGIKASSFSGNLYSNESSNMSNDFLFYEIENLGGTIIDKDQLTGETITYSPGDAGYAKAAWGNSQSLNSAKLKTTMGERVSTDDAAYIPFTVNIDQLSSGLLAPIALTAAGDYWTSFSAGNSDGLQHFKSIGNLSWRMEDQFNLGDADFNDLHVSLLATEIA